MLYLAMFAWGSNWVSAKILMDYFNAYELIFWRFFIAAFGLFFMILFMNISFKIDKREIFYSFICAIVLCLYKYIFFFRGPFWKCFIRRSFSNYFKSYFNIFCTCCDC
ncbi:EamA family transporter [Lebetimonas sp. JH369]|uniref:EamA family transporter n=1 Tax=Lebetimonas sp. JH369 TaxID=990069 RepID=UPI0035103AC8